tara:strand:- start:78 stop:425 length:348 start_codon:yes stop_codon:yes gene_type:complete
MDIVKEPQVSDYYNTDNIACFEVIEKMNEECNELLHKTLVQEEKMNELQRELDFVNQVFTHPLETSVIFNLVRVKKDGKEIWIDRIKIQENELRDLDQCDTVKYLLDNCNPRCER